jgi:hypothetical protein
MPEVVPAFQPTVLHLKEGWEILSGIIVKFIRAQELANRTTKTLGSIVASESIPSS